MIEKSDFIYQYHVLYTYAFLEGPKNIIETWYQKKS